jgi:hypothetical protein
MDPGRFGFMVYHFEYTHGTKIYTSSTPVTKDTVYIYFH